MASEKKLISVDDLKAKIEITDTDVCADYGDGFCQHGYSTQLLRLMINELPTVDAVEVVRCKDCRFNVANMATDPLDVTDYSDITCSYFKTDGMDADDFCSHGAKMNGGDKE